MLSCYHAIMMFLDTETTSDKAARIAELVGGVRPAARLCGVPPTQFLRWRRGDVKMRPDSQRLIDNTWRLLQILVGEIGEDANRIASVLQRPSAPLGFRSCQDFVRERRFDELFGLLGSYARQTPIQPLRDADLVPAATDLAMAEISDAEWTEAWASGADHRVATSAADAADSDERIYDLPAFVTLRSPAAHTNTMARQRHVS
jgi:hypothetical protein